MTRIILDVGGTIFHTTTLTLCNVDGFFNRMITGEWQESITLHSLTPIFIDRDADCFSLILSYLRSRRLCLDENTTESFLQRALLEADFYQLTDLSEMIGEEMLTRRKKTVNMEKDIYRSINISDVNSFFERGWAFVGCFKVRFESFACY